MTKLSIIIPAYNEKETIKKILDLIEKVNLEGVEKEIVIVDDGSTDGTKEILTGLKERYKIIFQEKNQGKGAAITRGLKEASGDIYLIQDADLEYEPEEYPKLLWPIITGKADVVYGSRFVGSEPPRVLFYHHYLGNKFLTFLSNLLGGLSLTDMETCYKVFNRSTLEKILPHLSAKRFGIEVQLTALVAKFKLRVYEVGISYYGRTYQEGKKINWRDGIKAIYYVIKYNLFK